MDLLWRDVLVQGLFLDDMIEFDKLSLIYSFCALWLMLFNRTASNMID